MILMILIALGHSKEKKVVVRGHTMAIMKSRFELS